MLTQLRRMDHLKGLCFVLFLFFSFSSKADQANIYLKHYNQYLKGVDNHIWSIVQGKHGVMYFANNRGVLSYDAVHWKIISTPSAALSLEKNQNGKIYVGCANGFGYISADNFGNDTYVSLSEAIGHTGHINKIYVSHTTIWFYSSKQIYQLSLQDETIKAVYKNNSGAEFSGMVLQKENAFVNIKEKGFQKMHQGKFFPIKDKTLAEKEIFFSLSFDERNSLLGTEDNEMYLFDGQAFRRYKPECQSYLDENFLTNALMVSSSEIGLATLSGGCVVIDKRTGKTKEFINYEAGLPDDEILSMGKDAEGGLWLAHEHGLSRSNHNLPFKNFSVYEGLKGKLVSVLRYNNTLYVATTEGVFYLTTGTVSEKKVRRKIKKKIYVQDVKWPGMSALLRNIDKKNKWRRSVSTNQYILVSTSKGIKHSGFVFREVEGIHCKSRQLLIFKNRLVVASNTGLYEIKNNKAIPIIGDTYINVIHASQDNKKILVGLKNGLIAVYPLESSWVLSREFKVNGNVSSIAEAEGKIWLGGMGKVVEINKKGAGKYLYRSYSLKIGHSENVLVRMVQQQISFFTSAGFFRLDRARDTLVEDSGLGNYYVEHPHLIADQNAFLWINSPNGWIRFSDRGYEKLKPKYLSFFPQIINIYSEGSSHIWIIDGENNLYRINPQSKIAAGSFNLHLRHVTNAKGNHLAIDNLEFNHKNSSVNFHFAAPHYLNENTVQYQCRLGELSSEWLDWSSDPKFEFPYLPSGKYVLHARARNVLGQITDIKKIEFKINPPYWRTYWFYLLLMGFLTTLLSFSIVLNRSGKNNFLSKILTFLTLIIFIELLHQWLESALNIGVFESPIIRFSLNVLLALLISPIEKFMEVVISKKKKKISKALLLYKKHYDLSKEWIAARFPGTGA